MTSDRIARDYLKRARLRRRALDTLLQGEGFADVVREAHEVAERGHAFYGDETALVGASELFGAGEAQKALALVDGLLAFYAALLGEPTA